MAESATWMERCFVRSRGLLGALTWSSAAEIFSARSPNVSHARVSDSSSFSEARVRLERVE